MPSFRLPRGNIPAPLGRNVVPRAGIVGGALQEVGRKAQQAMDRVAEELRRKREMVEISEARVEASKAIAQAKLLEDEFIDGLRERAGEDLKDPDRVAGEFMGQLQAHAPSSPRARQLWNERMAGPIQVAPSVVKNAVLEERRQRTRDSLVVQIEADKRLVDDLGSYYFLDVVEKLEELGEVSRDEEGPFSPIGFSRFQRQTISDIFEQASTEMIQSRDTAGIADIAEGLFSKQFEPALDRQIRGIAQRRLRDLVLDTTLGGLEGLGQSPDVESDSQDLRRRLEFASADENARLFELSGLNQQDTVAKIMAGAKDFIEANGLVAMGNTLQELGPGSGDGSDTSDRALDAALRRDEQFMGMLDAPQNVTTVNVPAGRSGSVPVPMNAAQRIMGIIDINGTTPPVIQDWFARGIASQDPAKAVATSRTLAFLMETRPGALGETPTKDATRRAILSKTVSEDVMAQAMAIRDAVDKQGIPPGQAVQRVRELFSDLKGIDDKTERQRAVARRESILGEDRNANYAAWAADFFGVEENEVPDQLIDLLDNAMLLSMPMVDQTNNREVQAEQLKTLSMHNLARAGWARSELSGGISYRPPDTVYGGNVDAMTEDLIESSPEEMRDQLIATFSMTPGALETIAKYRPTDAASLVLRAFGVEPLQLIAGLGGERPRVHFDAYMIPGQEKPIYSVRIDTPEGPRVVIPAWKPADQPWKPADQRENAMKDAAEAHRKHNEMRKLVEDIDLSSSPRTMNEILTKVPNPMFGFGQGFLDEMMNALTRRAPSQPPPEHEPQRTIDLIPEPF